ncbi:glycine zipper domain-containing protein [Komagataeibacter saccharivorans]
MRERPLFSLGIAAAVGTVLGFLFFPRRKG